MGGEPPGRVWGSASAGFAGKWLVGFGDSSLDFPEAQIEDIRPPWKKSSFFLRPGFFFQFWESFGEQVLGKFWGADFGEVLGSTFWGNFWEQVLGKF